MRDGERIRAHVISVWRESRKFFSMGGREGMLILTDAHLSFVQKTTAKSSWWNAVRQRQILSLLKSRNIMIIHDGYDESILKEDLKNPKNVELAFDNILRMRVEEKDWGSVLYLDYAKEKGVEKYQYSVAQDWVKYPAKDALKFMKVDWLPLVSYIKEHQIAGR